MDDEFRVFLITSFRFTLLFFVSVILSLSFILSLSPFPCENIVVLRTSQIDVFVSCWYIRIQSSVLPLLLNLLFFDLPPSLSLLAPAPLTEHTYRHARVSFSTFCTFSASSCLSIVPRLHFHQH